jgi:glycerophosphoryl diester phosphodiesterase
MVKVLMNILIVLLFASCTETTVNRADEILTELKKSNSSNVLVVAHRGDWRHVPENSLLAIENCIKLGVDMVEIDVRKTKDGKFILMHDLTIDRTTNGKGKVSDYTLKELKQFYLKDNQGGKDARITHYKIPTLEEALLTAKDKILVNLDKAYGIMKDLYPIIKKTNTENIVVLKGAAKPQNVMRDVSFMLDKVIYIPIVRDKNKLIMDVIKEHIDLYHPVAFEILLSSNDSILNESDFIKSHGARVWVNTLWGSISAGYEDKKALKDPEGNWGHLINKGVNMIQTDNPIELLDYLNDKGLRDF